MRRGKHEEETDRVKPSREESKGLLETYDTIRAIQISCLRARSVQMYIQAVVSGLSMCRANRSRKIWRQTAGIASKCSAGRYP